MNLKESFRSSIKSLFYNKLRSFLTMLGVIIGIFSVIALTSISEGIKQEVVSQVESLGANVIYVLPGKVNVGPPQKGQSKLGISNDHLGAGQNSLTYADVEALRGQAKITAVTGRYNTTEKLDDLNIFASVTGIDEYYNEVNKLELEHGQFISKQDREQRAKVAVIGHQANVELFNGKDPLGKTFKINGRDYRVIGVLKYQQPENIGPGSENLNTKIYLPISEILERKKNKSLSQIIIKVTSSEDVEQASNAIKITLRKNHPDENFTIIKQKDILSAINNILGALTAGLGGIAAISLLVGGIGIMNIMLVSVTERTREIGVRKAIGAKRRDILLQFLIEAIILSMTGGVLGVLAGIGGARILPTLIPQINTAIPLKAVIISMVFALLVGICFGVYPAAKASKLNPIEALRSE